MMNEARYIINCCGVITGWEAFFKNVASTRTIYFQVGHGEIFDTFYIIIIFISSCK